MDSPALVLMDDGQWALDVLLPRRPHATDHLEHGQYRYSRGSTVTGAGARSDVNSRRDQAAGPRRRTAPCSFLLATSYWV